MTEALTERPPTPIDDPDPFTRREIETPIDLPAPPSDPEPPAVPELPHEAPPEPLPA